MIPSCSRGRGNAWENIQTMWLRLFHLIPNVSKTDSKAQARENELDGVVPLESTLGLGQGSISCRESGKIEEIWTKNSWKEAWEAIWVHCQDFKLINLDVHIFCSKLIHTSTTYPALPWSYLLHWPRPRSPWSASEWIPQAPAAPRGPRE